MVCSHRESTVDRTVPPISIGNTLTSTCRPDARINRSRFGFISPKPGVVPVGPRLDAFERLAPGERGVVKSGESVGEEFAVEQRAIDTNVHEQSSVAPARVGGGVERYRDAPTVEFGMGKRARVLAPPMEPVRARFGFGDPFELVGRVLAVGLE